MTAPRLLLPDNYSKDNCPLTRSPWKLPPRKIVFWMICGLHNCPEENFPPPRKIVSRKNYTQHIFSPRIRNGSTFIDSCFLLFSFFMVWTSTRLWFLYKKKLYKHSETETASKRRASQEEIEYEIMKHETELFTLSQQIKTSKVDHRKDQKFCSRKRKSSIYLNFSRLVIFSMKF